VSGLRSSSRNPSSTLATSTVFAFHTIALTTHFLASFRLLRIRFFIICLHKSIPAAPTSIPSQTVRFLLSTQSLFDSSSSPITCSFVRSPASISLRFIFKSNHKPVHSSVRLNLSSFGHQLPHKPFRFPFAPQSNPPVPRFTSMCPSVRFNSPHQLLFSPFRLNLSALTTQFPSPTAQFLFPTQRVLLSASIPDTNPSVRLSDSIGPPVPLNSPHQPLCSSFRRNLSSCPLQFPTPIPLFLFPTQSVLLSASIPDTDPSVRRSDSICPPVPLNSPHQPLCSSFRLNLSSRTPQFPSPTPRFPVPTQSVRSYPSIPLTNPSVRLSDSICPPLPLNSPHQPLCSPFRLNLSASLYSFPPKHPLSILFSKSGLEEAPCDALIVWEAADIHARDNS
jgi:hypothetical protein